MVTVVIRSPVGDEVIVLAWSNRFLGATAIDPNKGFNQSATFTARLEVLMSRTPVNRWIISVVTVAALSWSPAARGDAVVDWNAIAVDAISKASPPRPGPVGLLDTAVVQAAVYDAVQAIGGKYKPYRIEIQGASGSPDAAAAKAAHDVLVNILPAQAASLETTYRDYLTKRRGGKRSRSGRRPESRRRHHRSAR
jgi:hypothetical protein